MKTVNEVLSQYPETPHQKTTESTILFGEEVSLDILYVWEPGKEVWDRYHFSSVQSKWIYDG